MHRPGCIWGPGIRTGLHLGARHQDGLPLGARHQDGLHLGACNQDGLLLGARHQDLRHISTSKFGDPLSHTDGDCLCT